MEEQQCEVGKVVLSSDLPVHIGVQGGAEQAADGGPQLLSQQRHSH